MPRTGHKRLRDEINDLWTTDTLAKEPSLVFGKNLWFDNHLSELKAGELAPATVEELLTKKFAERLWPGVYSEAGKKLLKQYKGSRVALLVAQCPQREAHLAGH